MPRTASFLRTLLLVDLVATVGFALALLLGAGALDQLLGASTGLLRGIGLALVPFAALQAYLVSRDQPPARAVTALIAGNALWAVASIAALIGLPLALTAVGTGFVIAQAVAVGALAELQTVGLRRARA
jgi:uncharacterized membrane protein required for colicin V production